MIDITGFFVILLLLLCIACYTGQNFFNRLFSTSYTGPSGAATPVFASIYGLIVGLVALCINRLSFAPSSLTWILGCCNGVILFLFNLGMIQAARTGPYAFQSIVMLFGNIVVSALFSAFYWGDSLTVMQLVGIAVMLASFVVLNSGGLNFSGVKKVYFLWVASLFLTNGIYGVLMDAQQRIYTQQRNEMIIITFLSSALVSLVYLLLTERGKTFAAFKMNGKARIFVLSSSLCAAFAVVLLMTLLSYIPVYILYTIINGSILVTSILLCAIVLKEKMTKTTVLGILLSVGSVILLSM